MVTMWITNLTMLTALLGLVSRNNTVFIVLETQLKPRRTH